MPSEHDIDADFFASQPGWSCLRVRPSSLRVGDIMLPQRVGMVEVKSARFVRTIDGGAGAHRTRFSLWGSGKCLSLINTDDLSHWPVVLRLIRSGEDAVPEQYRPAAGGSRR